MCIRGHRLFQRLRQGLSLFRPAALYLLLVYPLCTEAAGMPVAYSGLTATALMAEPPIPWYIVYGVLTAAVLAMLLVLVWNIFLRRSIRAGTSELQRELAERHKVETSLADSRHRLSMILDNLQGVAFYCTFKPDFSMDFLSRNCLEQTGYPADDFLSGKISWEDLVVPEDRPHYRQILEEAFLKQQAYEMEYRIITRFGQVKWVWDKGRGIYDEAGSVIAQEGFVLDNSHRKEVEDKLRSHERQLASIFKASPVGMGLVSNRVILKVNDQICSMTGYARDELIGQNSRMLYSTQEEYEKVGELKYHQIEKTGIGIVETRWRRKDGRIIDILLSSAPIEPDDLTIGVIFNALDITETKNARQMAIAERDKAQQYLDIAGVIMLVLDTDARIKLINKKGCQILECTESQALGKDWFTTFVPESVRKQTRKAFCDLIIGQGEMVEYFENTVQTTSGREKLIAWHNTIIRDETGQIVGTLSSGMDITENKAAEERLQLTQFAMDHAGEGVFLINEHARFEYVNKAACRSLGYTQDELLAMGIDDIDPDYDPQAWPSIWEATQTQKASRIERRHRRKDGIVFPVEITGNALRYEGRQLHCVFARDISERKAAEQALRFTQFAMDHAGEAAFWMTADGKFIYVNDAACQSLGYTRDELLRMYLPDIDSNFPREKWDRHWAESKDWGSWRFETQHQAKDGRLIPVEVSANFVSYEGVEYHCSFARDISERKAAETAREKLLRELQAKNEELESIVFIASHDLRSPLVNIRGFSGELEKSLQRLRQLLANEELCESARHEIEMLFKDDIAESLGFINTGNRKMDILLNGLLRLSRIGTAKISPTQLDMQQMFEGIVNSFRFRMRQKDIEITVDEVIPACRADAMLVNQVFTNLIENAIKYRSPDRPAKIHISGRKQNATVVYCVQDNGIGIAPEHIDKVFEIFHRLNPESGQAGEGLGLTIVRRILKRQDGTIRIESQPDVGTSVYVELPNV